jgi:two-component system LytT family response regulator
VVIRTVIIDDEPLARAGLRRYLERQPDIEIVAEANDGPSAVNAIKTLRPDLVFLDVQMPGFSGLETVKRVGSEHLPSIIFVTAFDRFAVQAFELNAVDFLLKPVNTKRLDEALRRARVDLVEDTALNLRHQRLMDALGHHERERSDADGLSTANTPFLTRFAVKHRDRFVILKVTDVDWVESAANYVQLHSGGHAYLLRTTLGTLEGKLDPRVFVRIHRTSIVNVDRVREVMPSEHGDFTIRLEDTTVLRMSRSFRERLFACMYRGSQT